MAKHEYNQCDLILNHMKRFGSISFNEAYSMYSCERLSARIFDLRKRGNNIITQTVSGTNKFGYPVEYAVYRLVKVGENV